MIVPFSISKVAPLRIEEYKLDVSFYKVESIEEGKISIRPLYEDSEEIDEIGDVFGDEPV